MSTATTAPTSTRQGPPPYRARPAHEMVSKPATAAALAEPPIPPLVLVVGDPERMKRIEQAAQILYPDDGDLGVVRLALAEAGIPAPPTTDVFEFIRGMERYGFKREPTAFAEPLPGSLYVECDEGREPVFIGIVAKVRKDKAGGATLRDYFYRAATTKREVQVSTVEFWLLSPAGCAPCAQRKRPATTG